MYNYCEGITDMGLCEPLWSVRLNCQLTKLELMHILHAQVCAAHCAAVLAHTQGCHIKNETGN